MSASSDIEEFFSRENSADTVMPVRCNVPASRTAVRKKPVKPAGAPPTKKRKLNEYERHAHTWKLNDDVNKAVESERTRASSLQDSMAEQKSATLAGKLDALQTVLGSSLVPNSSLNIADTLAFIQKTRSRLPPPVRYVDACVGTNTLRTHEDPRLEKQQRLEKEHVEKIEELNITIGEREREIRQLRGDKGQQAKKIEKQNKQVESMTRINERNDFDIDQLRRVLAEERETGQNREQELDEITAQKKSSNDAFKDRIDELKGTIDDQKRTIRDTEVRHKKELEKWNCRVQRHKSSIHEKDEQLTKASAHLKSAADKNRDLQRKISQNETIIKDQGESLKAAAVELSTTKRTNQQLINDMNGREGHIRQLERDLQQERHQVERLVIQHDQALTTARGESNHRLAQFNNASREKKTLEKKVTTLNETIKTKDDALAKSDAVLGKARDENHRLIDEKNKSSEELQRRVTVLTKDVRERDYSLTELRNTNSTLEKAQGDQTQRINVLEGQEEALHQTVTNLTKDCKRKDTDARKSQGTIHTLEKAQRDQAQRVQELEKIELIFRQRVAVLETETQRKDYLLSRSNDLLTKTKVQHRKSIRILKKGKADQRQRLVTASRKSKQLRLDKQKKDETISAHEITIQEKGQQAREKDAKIRELEHRVGGLTEEIRDHESNLQRQNRTIEDRNSRITDLSEELKEQGVTAGTTIRDLKKQVEGHATNLQHQNQTIEEHTSRITDLSRQLNDQEATMTTVIVVIAELYMRVQKYRSSTQEKDRSILSLTTKITEKTQEQNATQGILKTANMGIRNLRSSLQEVIAGFGESSSGRILQCSMDGVSVRVWVFLAKDSAIFLIQNKRFSLWRSKLAHARIDFDDATFKASIILETIDAPLILIPFDEDDDLLVWLARQLTASPRPRDALPRLMELNDDNLVEEINES